MSKYKTNINLLVERHTAVELVAVVAAVVDKVARVEGGNAFAIGALELEWVARFRRRTAAQRWPRRRGQRRRRQDTRAYEDGESH